MNNPGQFLKKLTALQLKSAALKSEMEKATFEGVAGGGLVRMTLNGKHEMQALVIDPSVLKEDADTVAALVQSAYVHANSQIESLLQTRQADLLKGMGLAGLNIPGLGL